MKVMKKQILKVLIALVLTAIPTTALAEGIVYYGGFGVDRTSCGSGVFPCSTYDYARGQACRYSENEGDVYHVYHVYNGYISSCDTSALSGREPGAFERNWIGYFQSLIIPLFFCLALGFIWRYYRVNTRIASVFGG